MEEIMLIEPTIEYADDIMMLREEKARDLINLYT